MQRQRRSNQGKTKTAGNRHVVGQVRTDESRVSVSLFQSKGKHRKAHTFKGHHFILHNPAYLSSETGPGFS